MKTHYLILAVFCICISPFLSGQIIPFKFKNIKSERQDLMTINMSALQTEQESFEQDTAEVPENLIDYTQREARNYYFELEEKFESMATIRNEDIEERYAIKRQEILKKLDIPSEFNERDLTILKEELEYLDSRIRIEKVFVTKLQSTAKEMRYNGRNLNKFKLLPVRNPIDAQLYYDFYIKDKKSNFLKNSIISFNTEGGKASIFNELFADYLGPFRLGVGVLISNTNTESFIDSTGVALVDSTSIQKDAVQRLLGGGGNAVFNFSYPLLGYTNSSQNLSIKLLAAPKFSVDVPQLGSANDHYSTNLDLGFEGSVFYTGVLDVITLYANFRLAYVVGNDNFYSNLVKDDQNPFIFNQTSFGVALNSTFRISWNIYWGDRFVKENFSSNIAFSIVPN